MLESFLILGKRRRGKVGLIVACKEKTSPVVESIGDSLWWSSQIILNWLASRLQALRLAIRLSIADEFVPRDAATCRI